MKTRWVKPTALSGITAQIQENVRVYNMFTREERAEVDAFNKAMVGKTIPEVLAMGPSPFFKYAKKYGK